MVRKTNVNSFDQAMDALKYQKNLKVLKINLRFNKKKL
jgi:hypothetical protein